MNAEFPAGLTIDGAISDALAFCKDNRCMVRANINDIPMVFAYGRAFGETWGDMVAYYAGEYRRRLKEKTDFQC